jgi:capsular polysaccharide transport system ATP-binding protein
VDRGLPLPPAAAALPAPGDGRIRAVKLCKVFDTQLGQKRVLDDVSFEVARGERMAVLGRNGSGKSTLIRILSGVMSPSSGHTEIGMRLSWPLALDGGFEGSLTGYDNIRFLCSLYDRPFRETYDYVRDFTELGDHLLLPMRSYSDGMRMRVAFGLSLAIEFDCILIDEVLFVGDQRFQRKCHHELLERRKDRAMIIAIHSHEFVTQHCSKALVLKNGRGRVFEDVRLAADIYNSL